jgi:hypothetical protein
VIDNDNLEKVFEYLEKLEKKEIDTNTKIIYSTDYKRFVIILI